MLLTEQNIIELVESDAFMMKALRAAQSLHLPDWMIGAGFIRNKIWDHLHGFAQPTPLSDIDLIYLDAQNTSPEHETELESRAKVLLDAPWSITNQARMHIEHGDQPYASTTEALEHWVETPTCIAVTLDTAGKPRLISPFGIDDLVNLRVAPNPKFPAPPEDYNSRQTKKQWQKIWPKLNILPPQ